MPLTKRSAVFLGSTAMVLLAVAAAWAALAAYSGRAPDVSAATPWGSRPRIDPDYTDLVIPPNIAPLNFRILEEGQDYLVEITPEGGEKLAVRRSDGKCRIAEKSWRRLLQEATGARLVYDVFTRQPDGSWRRFEQFANTVASDTIDSYIVYRLLLPNKVQSRIRGIFQRDLESFRESALITRRDETFFCFNCHSFCQHDPNRFLVQVRVEHPGMLLVIDGQTRMIDTKQDPMFRPIAYTSWHPNGRHVAGTCNRFIGHSPINARLYYFQALEKRGALVVYDVDGNTLSTTEAVFGHEYIETHPCWSADGKYIYYSQGRDLAVTEAADWERSEFDMMRVAYDVATDTWGTPEVVKAYSRMGLFLPFPRPSPCGNYVLHILADKTTYPIHQESSDVYLLDLATNRHRRLDAVCSNRAESFPRWSSNGRWFTFLSNRRDGMSALPYIAYFDQQGNAHKAFVLPQEDPDHYDTFIDTYNVVELVKSRVNTSAFRLAQGMQEPPVKAEFPNPPQVDAYTGPTPSQAGPY